jgi:spore coat polysaccharide biosynthesis protein SpsF
LSAEKKRLIVEIAGDYMKTVAIIQTRMGSSRLSGKVMKDLYGKTVLQHVIERVQQAKCIDEIVIATTIHEQDDVIAAEAVKCGVKFYRGSENDVLERYYLAATEHNADIVVRITSDCPLIDPIIVNEVIHYYKANKQYDIVTNAGNDLKQRTYPRGLDVEVFSYQALENAYRKAEETYQREHVTPYIYENSLKIYYYKNNEDYSSFRWTLDTKDDFILIKEIYRHLYKGTHDFYLFDILRLLKQFPSLSKINEHIEQKNYK